MFGGGGSLPLAPLDETLHTSIHSGSYKNWNFFVNDRIQKWVKEFNWIIGCPDDRDVILVRYEDLKQNVTREIGRMLDFLSFHLSSTYWFL